MSIQGKIPETGWRQYDTTLRNRTHAKLFQTGWRLYLHTTLRINVEKTLNFPKSGGILTKRNFQNLCTPFGFRNVPIRDGPVGVEA